MDNTTKEMVSKSNKTAKTWMIVGVALVAFFGVGGLAAYITNVASRDFTFVSVCLILVAIGIFLIYKSMQISSFNKLFVEYERHLSASANRSLEYVAVSTNTPLDVVTKHVQKMIDKGYFVGAYIDRNTNCLILEVDKEAKAQAQAETADIVCKSCGATTKVVPGQNNVCEYCGSPVEK